jgi:hypothetical protein
MDILSFDISDFDKKVVVPTNYLSTAAMQKQATQLWRLTRILLFDKSVMQFLIHLTLKVTQRTLGRTLKIF